MRWARWAYWVAVQYSYVIRPFDMLADRRRWFWQPRTPCSFSARSKSWR
jgi:hypothetical protein